VDFAVESICFHRQEEAMGMNGRGERDELFTLWHFEVEVVTITGGYRRDEGGEVLV
jgi:hypothetical protein